jgi:hypothetical protein
MRETFKNCVNRCGLVFAFAAALICVCGCSTSKPTPDPLVGWQMDFASKLDPVIDEDCQNYIQKLPQEEKSHSRMSGYFKDGTGQHAVQIEIALDGTWWEHVLIYDKNNKRVKTIKYVNGHYRS